MKKITLLAFIVICVAVVNAQTLYYVDGTSGNNSNSGTSLSKAWKTIQKACNSATPNSIVYIVGGTYHENDTVNVTGTPGNPITFTNYLNDSVFIDGTGTSGSTMFQMTDVSYMTFRNFTVQNLTVNNAQGILVQTSPSGKSTNLTFSNIRIKDINWTSSAAAIPNDTDNAQGFIAYGLDAGMTYLTLDSMQVFNNILGFSEAISLDGNISQFTISHCNVHDNTNIGIDLSGNYGVSSNPANDHIRNGTIEYNTCYNNVSLYATSGGIYADGSRDETIAYNTCYGNGYGIEIGCEQDGITDSITVRENLLFNNQENGMAFGGYTEATTGQVLNSTVRNNTFLQNNYAQDQSGELYMSKASNCLFENNIFYADSQSVLVYVDTLNPWANITFNYNNYYSAIDDSTNASFNWRLGSYSTFGTYVSGSGQDKASEYANPKLFKAYFPSPNMDIITGSPCINTGDPSTVIASGETDFAGNPRVFSGRIDQGAYEFSFVGIDNVTQPISNLLVYPNPFKASATIVFNEDGVHYIDLYDPSGHLAEQYVYSGKIGILQNMGLAQGAYLVRVYNSQHVFETVTKVLVQ